MDDYLDSIGIDSAIVATVLHADGKTTYHRVDYRTETHTQIVLP